MPMTPKQALCSAETAQMRGTLRLGGVLGVGGGIVASGGGFGPGFSLLGASGPIVEACLLARWRRLRPGVAGRANAVAVCSRALRVASFKRILRVVSCKADVMGSLMGKF